MHRHGIKGFIGGGAATMDDGPIRAYQEAGQRAGKNLKLGEGINIGIHMLLGPTREKALAAIKPLYEEHAKMFAPMGFLPGATDAHKAAIAKRGGWDAAGVPTVEHYMKLGSWFAGTSQDLVAHLKRLEAKYPGLEYINLSTPLCTPQSMMIEQFTQIAEEVMPHFRARAASAAAAE
jgi:hypothetical protein